jgi:arylformamidase
MPAPRPWIDISVPLEEGMEVWPGDPPLRFEKVATLARGDSDNVTAASLCLHTGTHIDGPRHYFDDAPGVESMPPEVMIGPAEVVALASLRLHRLRRGERLLLKTRPVRQVDALPRVSQLSEQAASRMAAAGVRLVGIEGLSIGSVAVHRILLEAGVWILEGLDLSRAGAGRYDLVALPLRIPGADGAPARALLRRR